MFDLTPVHVISSKYVPNWGAWEAYREVYCNTLDADPDNFIVAFPKGNASADFFTRTAPSWHNLFLLGDGTKGPGGETIGQFGEGLKNAALVAVRLGGNITIKTPTFTAHYELRNIPRAAAPVLYCVPTPPAPDNPREGCLVTLHIPGANLRSFEHRFVDSKRVLLDANPGESTRIYCKGVFICEMPHTSCYHYNLNTITINRDRAIPDTWSVSSAICEHTIAEFTDEDLRTLLLNPKAAGLETDALNRCSHYLPDTVTSRVFVTAKEEWGEKYCHLGTPSACEHARSLGYTLVVTERWATNLLGIKTADNVIPASKTRNLLRDTAPYAPHLRYLRSILRTVTPGASISIIENKTGDAEIMDNGSIHFYLPKRALDGDFSAAVAWVIASAARLIPEVTDDATSGATAAGTLAAKIILSTKKFDLTPHKD